MCDNKECVKHTPETHLPTCPKSGKNKCKDYLHIKECWTKEEWELLKKCLSNYE